MIGRKRQTLDSNNTFESSQSASVVKNRRPFSHPGKENIAPTSCKSNVISGFSQPFQQTDGGGGTFAQTQVEGRGLSQLDPVSPICKSSLDSHWTGSCVTSSLDELDSEILESPSLAELDSEILEGSAPGCRSACELQKLDCDGLRLVPCQSRSIESRLLSSFVRNGDREGDVSGCSDGDDDAHEEDEEEDDFEGTQFNELIKLCAGQDEFSPHEPSPVLMCPLCGHDISEYDEEARQFHANECLDNTVAPKEILVNATNQPSQSSGKPSVQSSTPSTAGAPVVKWLHSLGLARYEAAFVQQEIDWDSLLCLTEEDLIGIGITALGPRKKIIQSLKELRKTDDIPTVQENCASEHTPDATKSLVVNKRITDYFPNPAIGKKKILTNSRQQQIEKGNSNSRQRQVPAKNTINGKSKDVPPWCSIPGTPFRVDAFRCLRRDCSHWFLTHFHIDHYQGLTKSFSYGKIYCSMVTAKLVHTKIGIPWEKLQVMPLNQKINIAGVDVTCYDANHCPGSIIILFEPPNGKAVLHTGDFRFNEEMAVISALQGGSVHTLILDTTFCNPQYNFPKQEVVMQFVIEAIQAESFNPKTLFLIGSYTIGKERLFLEVARVLRKKIYVPAAKFRLLDCLDLPAEDMQWFTLNEHESSIHVVPMWTIASFKRLKQLSYQYAKRFSLIVAFSPTGWSLGKGKTSAGRRRQQGTIIRYEVPYSEHCSFEELREFVKLLSPMKIIPSVNNESEVSSNAMIELLMS